MSRGEGGAGPKRRGEKPFTPFGRAVYEAMVRKRRPDGRAWGVTDLARALKTRKATVSAWLTASEPHAATLRQLAGVLGVSETTLLRGDLEEIYLINLPPWMVAAIRAWPGARGPLPVTPSAGDVTAAAKAEAEKGERGPAGPARPGRRTG